MEKNQKRRIRISFTLIVFCGIAKVSWEKYSVYKSANILPTQPSSTMSNEKHLDDYDDAQQANKTDTTCFKIKRQDTKESSNTKKRTQDDNTLENWIVLLTVNLGFLDFFQNWYWYFRHLQLSVQVVVIAEDDVSFQKLTNFANGEFITERSSVNNIQEKANYNSKAFKKLTAARPAYIRRYLQCGTNVLYCDVDSVWLQNPFPYVVGDFDIAAQFDEQDYCAGFLAIKTSNRTIKLIEDWIAYIHRHPGKNDQDAFNALNKTEVKIDGLDMNRFPSGNLFFGKMDKRNRAKVVVVHNNYIIGHNNKLKRFKDFNIWKLSENKLVEP